LVIHYLLDGFSSKQIADKMHISINTINNHRQNILKKASCNNVAQLMVFVLKAGLK
jgi:DNA-binding NarL/FixJ family response regulator